MTNYLVSYEVIGTDKNYAPRVGTVTITDGYSTFEDIRKILAIKLGLTVENIDIQGMVKLS